MSPTLFSQTITLTQLAKVIDHSLLRPELTEAEVIAGCELARRYHVASVCAKPADVVLAARVLAGSDVAVGTVVSWLADEAGADFVKTSTGSRPE